MLLEREIVKTLSEVGERGSAGWFAHQQMEHLPGDEPFEAAQPHHSDAMQGGIGLANATPIQPVMPTVA
jgi:hypothetical protein